MAVEIEGLEFQIEAKSETPSVLVTDWCTTTILL